jgi:hypothetical protein
MVTNKKLMYQNPVLRTAIIIGILFLITYSLANGIKNGNALGTTLALGSMVALGFCIHFARKLAQAPEEEEQ